MIVRAGHLEHQHQAETSVSEVAGEYGPLGGQLVPRP